MRPNEPTLTSAIRALYDNESISYAIKYTDSGEWYIEWFTSETAEPTKDQILVKLDELQYQYKIDLVRYDRNQLLTDTDWIVVKHNELGTPIPQEWLDYRQALRDITEQTGFPENIDWPQEPES